MRSEQGAEFFLQTSKGAIPGNPKYHLPKQGFGQILFNSWIGKGTGMSYYLAGAC